MFNFSFGGPKDYKKTKSQVAMMDNDKVKTYVVVAALAGILVLLAYTDD
jgi:hypothetical protein